LIHSILPSLAAFNHSTSVYSNYQQKAILAYKTIENTIKSGCDESGKKAKHKVLQGGGHLLAFLCSAALCIQSKLSPVGHMVNVRY
jgi:hypothetical protein